MGSGDSHGPPVTVGPLRLPDGGYFDLEGVINEEADKFERATGQEIPQDWRDLLVDRVSERPELLERWFAQGRTTPDAIRTAIQEQFTDAWSVVREEPNLWDRFAGPDVVALVKSITRRCRFVFWCWGQMAAEEDA